MIVRTLQGKYYWPTHVKDAMRYSRDCDACQRFGPLKPTLGLKPILNLQPMDILGMDFLGPISPAGTSRAGTGGVGTGGAGTSGAGIRKNRYILIIVDYYSRFLFAEAVPVADGATVVRTLRKIAKTFGWPLAIYCDNASYFVKGQGSRRMEGSASNAIFRTNYPPIKCWVIRALRPIGIDRTANGAGTW